MKMNIGQKFRSTFKKESVREWINENKIKYFIFLFLVALTDTSLYIRITGWL